MENNYTFEENKDFLVCKSLQKYWPNCSVDFSCSVPKGKTLVLFGHSGSGKSTVGRLLAQKLGRCFVDSDAEVEQIAGITIPEIFNRYGETAFRMQETNVLRELGQKSGLVIATGGGCVTKLENYPLLHQNGTIYWIKRPIASLPTVGRPLSQANMLEQMYQIRKPMYEQFADNIVINSNTPEDVVAQILKERDEL
jgi:shikimate dehydrogenase